jgi:hypothetical protein
MQTRDVGPAQETSQPFEKCCVGLSSHNNILV